MFHSKIIILTVILACFCNHFVQVESTGYILDKLRSFSQTACDFFHPSRKSTTVLPTTEENYNIDVRLNTDGPNVEPGQGNTRKLINVGAGCPPGEKINQAGQCRPVY